MSPNVRMIWGCLWGPCGTLERALVWIHSSHLCYSALQALVPLLTELRGHLGVVFSQGQEAWDPWAAVSPHRITAATDKEPTRAARALWHSASCLGNFESHLEPLEVLLGWPSEWWTPGNRSHGVEGLHRGHLTLQLSTWYLFAKSSYRIWILFGTGFCLLSHHVSQPQIRSSANINLPQVAQEAQPGDSSKRSLDSHLSNFVNLYLVQFSSVTQLCQTLWSHWLKYTRPPWPSPTPRVYSTSCPLSWWCHSTASSFVVPFSSHFQSLPASGSFPMSQLFASGGQSIGVSASTSVFPMNIQHWFPLGWTGWISLQSKGLSRVFSSTTVQSINSSALSFLNSPTLTSIHDSWRNHSLD